MHKASPYTQHPENANVYEHFCRNVCTSIVINSRDAKTRKQSGMVAPVSFFFLRAFFFFLQKERRKMRNL